MEAKLSQRFSIALTVSYGIIPGDSANRKYWWKVFFYWDFFLSVFLGIPDATDLITIFARERSITIIAPVSVAVLIKLNKLCFQMNNKHMKLHKGLYMIYKTYRPRPYIVDLNWKLID